MITIPRILPFLILLVLAGCKKDQDQGCAENLLATIVFTPEERAIIPYAPGDSLSFHNDSLNSLVTFACNDQVSYFLNYSKNHPGEPYYSGCLGDYYKTELWITHFDTGSLPYRGIQIV